MRPHFTIFPHFRILPVATVAIAGAIALLACSGINDSWEVKGGGYIKYRINDGDSHTIELDADDVEIPFIRNSHHYLFFKTRLAESSRGDQLSLMVNRPALGNNAIVQGQYSWFSMENSDNSKIYADSSVFHIDQKDDSTWTADMTLYVDDCRSGRCSETLPRLKITGRFRYWIPEEYR